MKSILIGLLAASSLAFKCYALPQDIKFPVDFAKLAERATESVDVTLDASMLQLASGFLSKDDPDEAQVKKLVSKLKGVYVRSFEFDKEGQYSPSEVDAIRSQLKSPGWSRIVGVKSSKGENSDIFLKKTSDTIMGLVVIAAEPKELTVVYIDGPIRPEELSQLGGHMGIPQIGKAKNDGSNGSKKAKEED